MGREPANGRSTTGTPLQQTTETGDEMTAGDGQAVCRDVPVAKSIARGEGSLQQRVDVGGEWMMRIVESQRATATEQMRQAGLVTRVNELAIGGPPIALQDARIIGVKHGGSLREPRPS